MITLDLSLCMKMIGRINMDKVTHFKEAVKATQQAQQTAAQLKEDIEVAEAGDIDKDILAKSHEDLVKEMITWQRRYSEVA